MAAPGRRLRAVCDLMAFEMLEGVGDHSYDGRLSKSLAARCAHVVCVSHAMARQFGSLGDGRLSDIGPVPWHVALIATPWSYTVYRGS